MPVIFANAADGHIDTGNLSSHANARGASTGTAVDDGNSSETSVRYFRTTGRGSATVSIKRAFFWFDTSGITGTVSEATFKIFADSAAQGPVDIIAVKSNAFGGDGGTALANDDFNNVDFSTPYSAQIAAANLADGAYRDIALNSDALTDMKNNDAIIIALLQHDNDFADSEPSDVTSLFGHFFTDQSGTSKDPKIDYTLATGYSHDIMGLAAASIGKVSSLATANVGKVSGT